MTQETDNQTPTELEKLQKQCEEYLNNWKRAAADFINYKKDETERAGVLVGYVKESMFLHFLPIIDSMYLAAAAFGKDGFIQVEKQIAEFLKKEGIEEIKVEGQPFNPETMEAVGEAEGGDKGTAVEEVQKGYKMGEKILRPAKVKINK